MTQAGRVLIVEDSTDIAWLAGFHLRDAGWEVKTITGEWRQLFDVATWVDIDVAVVDLHLHTEITGLDVLRWLAEYLPGIRRVVFTASLPEYDAAAHDEVKAVAHALVTKLDVASALLEAVEG